MKQTRDSRPRDLLARGLESGIRQEQSVRLDRDAVTPSVPTGESVETVIPDKLAGYRVREFIASGGTGSVYRVADPNLDRDLAIKVLSRRHASSPEMIRRFEDEAIISGQLQHPGIVPIHERSWLEDGRPFFTMKFVEGDTLAQLLKARRDLSSDRRKLLEIFEKVCQTIAYVHAQGVVHGDLKPSNIMVGAFGEVQVMDWGFARVIDPERTWVLPRPVDPQHQADDSSSFRVLGTPAYMAPEQARGDEEAISTRTDVFGLGSILCRILTDRPPNRGSTRAETLVKAAQGWHEDTRELLCRSGANPVLVDLATRCLAADPSDRPDSASAIEDAVSDYLESLEERAYRMELRAIRAEVRASQDRRRRKTLIGLTASIVVTVVAIAGSLLWVEFDHFVRQRETHRMLAEANERSLSLRRQAESQPIVDLALWQEALEAAELAEELARSSGASRSHVAHTTELRAQLGAAAARASTTREILDWLDAVRPRYDEDRRPDESDRAYLAGLTRFDVLGGDASLDAVARRIRETSIAAQVSAAFDDWAVISKQLGERAGRDWRQLLRISQKADPDPLRDRIREALLASDTEELRAVVTDDDFRSAPPPTVHLLAKCLDAAGLTNDAIALLRTATVSHPSDYLVHHDLALILRSQAQPPWTEIVSLCRTCTALRPDNPQARVDYARVMLEVEDMHIAESVLSRVNQIAPEYAPGWRLLARLLHNQGRFEEARVAIEHALTLAADPAVESRLLADSAPILLYLGDPGAAWQTAERAALASPHDPWPAFTRIWIARQTGRLDWASRALENSASSPSNSPEFELMRASIAIEGGHLGLAREILRAEGASSPLPIPPYQSLDLARELETCDALDDGYRLLQDYRLPTQVEDPARRAWAAAAAGLRGEHRVAVDWYASSFTARPELTQDGRHARWAAIASALTALAREIPPDRRGHFSQQAAGWLDAHLASIPDRVQDSPERCCANLLWIRRIQSSPELAPFWHDGEGVPTATRDDWAALKTRLQQRAAQLLR